MATTLPYRQLFCQPACCQSCNHGRRARSYKVAELALMSERPSLHRHLAAWRDRKGLSQEHVANILGVNKSTIHRWETGKRAVDLTDLQRLAEIYEIDALALLLSPNDLDLAERLNRAKAILTAIPADQADRWLAMGGDLAASKLPKMQQPD